jgi:UDP-N-acetylglucosamine 2-epimerase
VVVCKKKHFSFKSSVLLLESKPNGVELIDGGFNRLLPAEKISDLVQVFDSVSTANVDFSINLYGKGKASLEIVEAIKIMTEGN